MNIKKLKDQELHHQLISSIKEEKKIISQILHLLKEVEARKLYCDFNCRSLFDYATKILKYSEAEAYSRINAMRLIREFPEIAQKIEDGELSLTNVAQAQSFFRRQEIFVKSKTNSPKVSLDKDLILEQKRQILSKLKNQSTRQAKQILSDQLPEQEKNESVRTLNNGRIEIKFYVDETSFNQIQALKNRFSKPGENLSLKDLLQKVFIQTTTDLKEKPSAPRKQGVNNKTLTPAMRLYIKQRDEYSCQNCGSTKNIEIDHIQPQALGGGHRSDNLQSLCRPCNQRRAIKTFGVHIVERAALKNDQLYCPFSSVSIL